MIIALTTVMLLALLVLTPLHVRVDFCLDTSQKALFVYIKMWFITFFKEKFTLQGKYLVCNGTVDTDIDLLKTDKESGKNYIKMITVDSVNITISQTATQTPYSMLVKESVAFTATAVACAISNCKVSVSTQFAAKSGVLGEVRISVSLADVLYALIKDGVRRLKKSRKAAKN